RPPRKADGTRIRFMAAHRPATRASGTPSRSARCPLRQPNRTITTPKTKAPARATASTAWEPPMITSVDASEGPGPAPAGGTHAGPHLLYACRFVFIFSGRGRGGRPDATAEAGGGEKNIGRTSS